VAGPRQSGLIQLWCGGVKALCNVRNSLAKRTRLVWKPSKEMSWSWGRMSHTTMTWYDLLNLYRRYYGTLSHSDLSRTMLLCCRSIMWSVELQSMVQSTELETPKKILRVAVTSVLKTLHTEFWVHRSTVDIRSNCKLTATTCDIWRLVWALNIFYKLFRRPTVGVV
jgi:hypothetical protein